MIKGHTKIELVNVKTGQKKVIEDDNMITNAISKMFESTPYCGCTYVSNPFSKPSPLIDKLCGGILLFSDPIEEDPDNYLTPKNNKMVGNARVNYASGQDVPEFGAYNAEESTWNPDTGERKYVYDFSTSKGNGTISCVALTNPLLGYYGIGNPSEKKESVTVENINYSHSHVIRDYFWGNSNCKSFPSSCSSDVYSVKEPCALFADYNKNCIYAFGRCALQYSSSYASEHISSGKFNLYKIYFPMNLVNPMERLDSIDVWRIQEKIEIEVPSTISSLSTNYATYSCVCRGDDAVYIVFGNNVAMSPNSTFYVWKIGYDLTTSEVFTMRNTTGATIVCGDRSQQYTCNFTHGMFVSDGYLICTGYSNNRVFKMKLSDPTDVAEFKNNLPDTSNTYYRFYKLGGTIIICNVQSSSSGTGSVILDENVILPVNGSPSLSPDSGNDSIKNYNFIPVHGCESFVIATCKGDYIANPNSRLVRDPFMLSTINNLPEPVVKTADLAMKITYTLSLDTSDEQEAGDS